MVDGLLALGQTDFYLQPDVQTSADHQIKTLE